MKKLVKDADGNIVTLVSVNGSIPDGWTELSEEELSDGELSFARKIKLGAIRSRRDLMLIQNDKAWIIASKKGEPVTSISADAQILRDLPEAAQTALDAMESVEDIEAYDAFADLELSQSYE